ncbi:MAG TPA: gephyrin-like molybdotransferase Glp [Solirubrobacterales bacterium]
MEDARRLVLERVSSLDAELVPLRDALGRILAVDVTSADPVPGFDNSSMDGFAVRAEDTRGAGSAAPVTLTITDESRAGRPARSALRSGEAIGISTGAVIPDGADSVVRVEDTSVADGRVEVGAEVKPGSNLRHAGDDIEPGAKVLSRGARIGAAELGVLASVGVGQVPCARRPRLAVLTTGDELLEPEEPQRLGGVRNSNAYTIPALALSAGAEVVGIEAVRDEPESTRAAIERMLGAEIVVICGGVSVGQHDHVKGALGSLGVDEVFWRVALKPGKPTWFGIGPSGTLVFGLPGNPVSAMVTFLLFVRPAIVAMTGAPDAAQRLRAVLDQELPKPPGRAHAVRCRLELRDDGWHARPTGDQDSHVLTSMLGAEALAIVPADADPPAVGELVELELLPALGSAP